MAFLDNSGDIVLDAVLTDTGRMRLARGDGSFKIAKFAFADDEINYTEYNKNHSSGSAYYDLEILQTPVLEAFTNNASSMKSKLLSISRTNLLYLPVIELNTTTGDTAKYSGGYFGVAVDLTTEQAVGTGTAQTIVATGEGLSGFMFGANPVNGATHARVDQGLDTTEISADNVLDADLLETQYIVEMDNRFGSLVSADGATSAALSYVDDDNIASYYLSLGTDANFVKMNEAQAGATNQSISGPRGTTLEFAVQASIDLNSSTFFFTELGSTFTPVTYVYYYIDTTIRVTGATTGYRIDIPIRYVKYKSAS